MKGLIQSGCAIAFAALLAGCGESGSDGGAAPMGDAVPSTIPTAEDAGNLVDDIVNDAREIGSDVVDDAKTIANDTIETAKDEVGDVVADVKDQVNDVVGDSVDLPSEEDLSDALGDVLDDEDNPLKKLRN